MLHKLQVVQTHASMFGVVAAVRDTLSALIGTKFSKEPFDRRHGVDTGKMSLIDSRIPMEAMAEAVDYEPANEKVLAHVFRSLPFDPRAFHLVDIGCGKGRTLMIASRHPFRRITGIELSPITSEIARANVTRFISNQSARCSDIEVRCENGTDFPVPSGNLFCVLYNPFFGQTFQRCIEHLHRAQLSEPDRQLWLAYINPWHCEEYLMSTGYFRRVANFEVIPRTWKWNLWTHV
jgi:SAM-dependent methyltransferase